jgi:hypothetical protein
LLAGVVINLKIFGALYLLPLALACLPLVPSWSGLIGAAAIGGGLFVAALALPFEVGSFSLQNYIANIAMVTHQGLIISAIRESLFYGLAILALPLLTWRALGDLREERVMAIALAVCTVFVAVVSGEPGGGPPYMMPLIPSALYLAARLSCREGVAQRSETTKTRRLVLCAVLIGASPMGLQLVPDGEADSSLSHGVGETRRAALAFRGLPQIGDGTQLWRGWRAGRVLPGREGVPRPSHALRLRQLCRSALCGSEQLGPVSAVRAV